MLTGSHKKTALFLKTCYNVMWLFILHRCVFFFFSLCLKRKGIFWWSELNFLSVSSRWCMIVPCDRHKRPESSWNFLDRNSTAFHDQGIGSEHALGLWEMVLMLEKWYASLTAFKTPTFHLGLLKDDLFPVLSAWRPADPQDLPSSIIVMYPMFESQTRFWVSARLLI